MREISSLKCLDDKHTPTIESTLKLRALRPVSNNRKSTFP